ncbi:hypothetical protein EBT31_21960 [bacterium]|nr:hypothetical protein [bacterium]
MGCGLTGVLLWLRPNALACRWNQRNSSTGTGVAKAEKCNSPVGPTSDISALWQAAFVVQENHSLPQ